MIGTRLLKRSPALLSPIMALVPFETANALSETAVPPEHPALIALVAFGLVLFPIGGWYAFTGGRDMLRAFRSARWPTGEGLVIASGVTVNRPLLPALRTPLYRPAVRYRFAAPEGEREGDVIRFGLAGTPSKSDALAELRHYRVGTEVGVRYHPTNPAVATLDVDRKAASASFSVGVFLLCLPLFASGAVYILFDAASVF